jgi:hypothetical protein
VLYLRHSTRDASPKAISGRTSYLRVRLAYHPYPQLIGWFCITNPFGPPRGFTPASPWPWVAHPVSGLLPATKRPFKTRFRYGSGCNCLNLATESNSPAHTPRGTPSGLAGFPAIALRLLVGTRFQVLFHSPHRGSFHLSLTVLVHYRSPRVFSLGGWSPLLPPGFHVSRGTQAQQPGSLLLFAYGAFTLSGAPFQDASAKEKIYNFLEPPQRLLLLAYNPHGATAAAFSTPWVWALPLSLATTRGISVDFFSSAY